MELYLWTVTSKDAFSAPKETSEAHLVTALSNSCVVLYVLQPFLVWAGMAIVYTLVTVDYLLSNTAFHQVSSFASLSSTQEQSQYLELRLPTSSVPTPAWNKCHQKCWMNIIYTSWFLRRSFRTALIIIRRFTIVYYKFFNLHKSLYDGYNPEVHFSILKVTKKHLHSCWFYITYNNSAISHVHKQLLCMFFMF